MIDPERLGKCALPDELHRRRPRSEILCGRELTVGSVDALKGHPKRAARRPLHLLAFEQGFLLGLEGHRDDFPENLVGPESVEPELAGPALHAGEELRLAFVVTQERKTCRLDPRDVAHCIQTFAQNLQQATIDDIQPAAQALQPLHGPRLYRYTRG